MKAGHATLCALSGIVIALATARTAPAQPSQPRTVLEVGAGPAVSTRPSWAIGGSAIGVGSVLRLTSAVRFGRIGAEWLGWFGRGEEYSAEGFPSPTRPPVPPRTARVLLQRSTISAVAQVNGPGATDLKAGVGGAFVEGIEQCECLDVFMRTRSRRITPAVTIGVGTQSSEAGTLRLSPAFDIVIPTSGRGAVVAAASLVIRWGSRNAPAH